MVACRVSGVTHHAAALDHLRHGLVDAAMQRIVEMLRLDQRADALHRPVVHQDRAEQSLLDIDVVGDVAIGFLFHDRRRRSYGRSVWSTLRGVQSTERNAPVQAAWPTTNRRVSSRAGKFIKP